MGAGEDGGADDELGVSSHRRASSARSSTGAAEAEAIAACGNAGDEGTGGRAYRESTNSTSVRGLAEGRGSAGPLPRATASGE